MQQSIVIYPFHRVKLTDLFHLKFLFPILLCDNVHYYFKRMRVPYSHYKLLLMMPSILTPLKIDFLLGVLNKVKLFNQDSS
jgi:hypothetical protein